MLHPKTPSHRGTIYKTGHTSKGRGGGRGIGYWLKQGKVEPSGHGGLLNCCTELFFMVIIIVHYISFNGALLNLI